MKISQLSLIYDNPLPQLRSRQSAFPFLCECADGTLLAAHAIGEAFESVDMASCLSRSSDGGKTWSAPKRMFPAQHNGRPVSDCCKVTALADSRLIALGYAYYRDDPELPLGNPETGGLLDDFIFYAISEDNGETWSPRQEIPCAWGPHAEASAPLTVLADGTWVTPITGFPKWDGTMTGKLCGRLLRSEDQGKTWQDDAVCMAFDDAPVTCYEQRLCQLASGALVCIGWNEDTATGKRLPNHYVFSADNGRTWSAPVSTGILGQASSVCAIGGERLLALHAVRRDTDRPGIYGYIVDFSKRTWDIVEQGLLWEPDVPMRKDRSMAEIFSFLKFGQPGALLLRDGSVLMSFWYAQEGQYRTVAARLDL